MTILAGIWLLLAPFVLDQVPAADGLGAYWNDLVLGTAIVVLASIRMVASDRLPWLSLVNALLGPWLVASPFVLECRQRRMPTKRRAMMLPPVCSCS
ncbi:hypothetical protein [Lentzea sp. NEAU-D7]|uniref:SPW repeat domain-containing protein n=1 Tax=Lentzea sp. NEAU-D7 TaxID=2994667 RepID=UPI00224AD3DC|nr:hypothetical protein [Lentzea sp. NEAU-D7]MCX2948906.1 hypothetical protein [Lentzea sp. NEAU-D7]